MASANRSTHNSQRRPHGPLRNISTSHDALNMQSRYKSSPGQNGEWVEPPLRTPAPSFEDSPGIFRQGVLETMMPLGTRPSAKVKARAKGDRLCRVVQARNLSGMIVEEERATPETPGLSDSTRAGSLRPGGLSLRESPTVDDAMEVDEPPSPPRPRSSRNLPPSINRVVPKVHTQNTSSSHSPLKRGTRQGTPGSRTIGTFTHSPVPAGSPYFTAAAFAKRNGSPEVQPPLAFLYSSAENDPELSRLLHAAMNDGSINDPDSLLSRKIKQVKKAYRSQNSSPRSRAGSTVAARRVSGADSSRADTARNSVSPATRNTINTIGPATHNNGIHRQKSSSLKIKLNVHATSPSTNHYMFTSGHVSSPRESVERPPAISRRSSTSSLSSADSEILNQPPPMATIFPPRPLGPPNLKRPSTGLDPEDPDAPEDPEIEETRKRMKATLPHSVVVKRSAMRNQPSEAIGMARSLRSQTRTRTVTPAFEAPGPAQAQVSIHGSFDNHVVQELGRGKRNRESTPAPTALGRPPSKRQKATLSTKIAPTNVMVTGTASVAGVPIPATVPGNEDDDSDTSSTTDNCSACGGQGLVLCCDGPCKLAYHPFCVDPPYIIEEQTGLEWFCPPCKNLMEGDKDYAPGAFQEIFQSGKDGEYEHVVPTKFVANAKENGYYRALKDKKGNTILCHSCGKSCGDGKRDLLPCDFCSLYWHPDCLDPPLAHPPLGYSKVTRRPLWQCPLHADPLDQVDLEVPVGLKVDRLYRVHRHSLRRPTKGVVVKPQLQRGLRNNGVIEVESEKDADDAWVSEEDMDGTIYKLPREGIILDFIDKVKRDRVVEEEGKERQRREIEHKMQLEVTELQLKTARIEAANAEKLSRDIQSRRLEERQAALSLVQFKTGNPNLALGVDEMENLIMTLEAEAPPEVTRLMTEPKVSTINENGNAPASTINKDGTSALRTTSTAEDPETNGSAAASIDRDLLLLMQERIAKLLAAGTNDT